MFCLNETFINKIDDKKQTFNDCYLNTYLLAPGYLLFAVLNSYQLGSSNDLSRNFKFRILFYLRSIASILLTIILVDLFAKYFLILNGNQILTNNDSILISNLINDLYKLFSFTIHTILIYNKNILLPKHPIALLISIFIITISNLINFINYLFEFDLSLNDWSKFKSLNQFQKYNFISLIFYNLFLLIYLVLILLTYSSKFQLISIDSNENINSEEDLANYYSYLTFKWLKPLMKKGFKREITSVNDLSKLPSDLNIRSVCNRFMSKYITKVDTDYLNNPIIDPDILYEPAFFNKNIKYEDVLIIQPQNRINSRFNLIKSLLKSFGRNFAWLGVLRFMNDCLSFSGPLLLNQLVQFVEIKDSNLKDGLLYAAALFFTSLIGSLLNIHFSNLLNKFCLRIRTSLISLVYRKAVLVKLNELNKYSIGQIVNYMSIDTDSIVNAFPSFHSFWSLPFQLIITLYLLYLQIGLSFLVGVAFVIILIPINKFISDYIGKVQTKLMLFKDQRVKIMTEFLEGIRVIKFYSWEKYFINRIDSVRQKELGKLKAKKYLDASCVYFWACTPILMSVLTFTTYVLIGNKLTPSKVFTSLALFNMLISPLNSFPWVINGLVQAWVSLNRLENFLNLENLNWLSFYSFNELDQQSSSSLNKEQHILIDIRTGDFNWKRSERENSESEQIELIASDNESEINLKEISLQIKKGDLIGIIGKVGSGKTTLLHALMAELEKLDGKIRIDTNICSNGFAYVGQEVWVQQGSIKENILFGSEYKSDLYEKVIDACALRSDLNILPRGDDTPVGENGICLSGGQKARLTLARACYNCDKEVYLLDDPISAVDSHVAKHIFSDCINGLLKDKTRIISTHHYEYLENADLILVIDNGRIVQSGKGTDIIPDLKSHKFSYVDKLTDETSSYLSLDNIQNEKVTETEFDVKQDKNEDLFKMLDEEELKKKDEEEKEQGVINFKVYKYYCVSAGILLSIFTLLSLFLMQASRNLTDFWLSYWTQHHHYEIINNFKQFLEIHFNSHSRNKTYILNPYIIHFYNPKSFYHTHNLYEEKDDTKYFFIVYGLLCFANTFFTLIRSFIFAYSGISAGKHIHQSLIKNLTKASLKYFDNTPKGRILNRLSSDMYAIDDSLPFILNIFLACLFGLSGILVVTCYSLPWFSLSLIPLSIIYYSIQSYYRWTSRELKRLSSISLSPLYTHFHETIRGLVTIRAFRKVKNFSCQNEFYLNNYIRASYASMAASQWLSFRLQMISVLMITLVGVTAVVQHIYGTSNASLIGLALSYILSVTGLLNGLITSFTETEKEMVSVERAHQFQNLESENWFGSQFVSNEWPLNPKIEFYNVCLRYNQDANLALNNVSFTIKPGEKVGICGRTGSGKSSLLMSLFRGCEIESGEIRIDDLNIRNLNLSDLRENLSIIPQDPFLFESTLRQNLDPTGLKSDDELWTVLKDTHLDIKFRNTPAGLDTQIEEKGKNLSSGEKQLICLARAVLSNRKILCIDEATAQVDFETDNFIQDTIRSKFIGITVLTIAHRINTIIDYDKILVMDNGRVAEFDTAKNLLDNRSSLFYGLVNEMNVNKTKKSF